MPTMNRLKDIAHRIMIQRGLLRDFSSAVLSETSPIVDAPAARVPPSVISGTSSGLPSTTTLPVKIFVAVADVDAVVKRGSAIDDHAGTNTTSVYTAAAILPMLLERLSTDLTSLGEGQ